MTYEEIRKELKQYRVGIAGAGGLGSNCAVSLVRAGIVNLIVADYDVVTESNLNRQFYFSNQLGMKKVAALKDNLMRIYLDLNIQIIDKKLGPNDIPEIFKDCHVVVEAFDDKVEKQMFIEAMLEYLPGKPVVIGLGMAGWGSNNLLRTECYDNVYICGDQQTEIANECPPLGPRVSIVANMQANMVLELLLGKM